MFREDPLDLRGLRERVRGGKRKDQDAVAAQPAHDGRAARNDERREGEKIEVEDEVELPRRRADRRGDDEHDEPDLLRLLDRRAEADDRERAEEAQRERQRELHADEERRHREREKREGAVDLAPGAAPLVEEAVEQRRGGGRGERDQQRGEEVADGHLFLDGEEAVPDRFGGEGGEFHFRGSRL